MLSDVIWSYSENEMKWYGIRLTFNEPLTDTISNTMQHRCASPLLEIVFTDCFIVQCWQYCTFDKRKSNRQSNIQISKGITFDFLFLSKKKIIASVPKSRKIHCNMNQNDWSVLYHEQSSDTNQFDIFARVFIILQEKQLIWIILLSP